MLDSEFFSSAGGLAVFILGFGFIVFVHELGHFAVAKWVGIKVEQFAVGMGHAIVSYRKGLGFRMGATAKEVEQRVRQRVADFADDSPDDMAEADRKITAAQYDEARQALGIGETEYRIAWIPIGGYVKMLGQDDTDPNHRSDDPRSYNNKSVGARMAVISAGVIMNIIFGLLFFMIAFMAGVNLPPPIAGDVIEELPAGQTYAEGHDGDPAFKGLKPDDYISHVNGEETLDFTDVMLAAALSGEGEIVELTVRRDGISDPLTFKLSPIRREGEKFYVFGIAQPSTLILPTEEDFISDDLRDMGVKPEMTLVEFNGQPMETYSQFRKAMKYAGGRMNELVFRDEESGEVITAMVKPALQYSAEQKQVHFMGLVPAVRVAKLTEDDSPAAKAGVQPGDVIAEVGGRRWPARSEIPEIVGDASEKGEGVNLTVMRDGQEVQIGTVTPEDGLIGIQMDWESNYIAKSFPDTKAAELNLPGGSQIVAVNDVAVSNFSQAMVEVGKMMDAENARTVTITILSAVKDSQPQQLSVELTDDRIASIRSAGLSTSIGFQMLQQEVQTSNPIAAAGLGVRKTKQTMEQVYLTLMRLIQTRVSVKEMRGPVGIAEIGTVIARDHGPSYFFFFLGLISVNLAVINFLPVPVVDGGHMVFLLLEKIKGSPVNVKIQEYVTYAGFALILTVFVFTFYNDAMRLIVGS